jgi:1,2-diacylglycerol 3-alpha-glucosyltransferase
MIPRPLIVSDVYFPRVNGVSTSIRSFRNDLTDGGVSSLLVTPTYAGETKGETGVLRVPGRPVPFDPEDSVMNWRALRRCLDSIPADQFNLVHIQTPFLAHYAGLKLARERRVPVVVTCHTYFEDYLHHYLPLLPRAAGAWIARGFMTHQLNGVDAVVSPSAQVRDRLLEYGVKTPIVVIPTGMTAQSFVPGNGSAFRAKQGISSDVHVLLTVGRVAYEKNLTFLLRMFARLRLANAKTLLVIAGEGPALKSLQAQARELGIAAAVKFVGNLDRETELNDCYAAADAFVFASRTETQGLVLLEAMAQARPIVSTACLGTRSVLTADSGAYVEAEDEADFAAAALAVLKQPNAARVQGERGRDWARTWSSRAMATRMADLYADLLISVPAQSGASLGAALS